MPCSCGRDCYYTPQRGSVLKGMNEDHSPSYLFEVSWEVCNKVGGIHTVLRTKIAHAVSRFGDGYILIGPDVGNNPEFEETDEALWDAVKREVRGRNLACRCGRWNTKGRPRVILVHHHDKYKVDELLYNLWKDFGVDSMTGGWDYIEPVLFGTAWSEVVHVLHDQLVGANEYAVVQFHEWMSCAGMLYLRKYLPEAATVFTTHATVLGRALAGSSIDIYAGLEDISPKEMAAKMNVVAKHSMEAVSAREADCFTTVSKITAREAAHFLGRTPDVVLPNGINISDIPDCLSQPDIVSLRRQHILDFASRFFREEFDEAATKIFIISGRYEFKNKGIDLFLESLKTINDSLKQAKSGVKVVAIVSVIGGHLGVSPVTRQILEGAEVQPTGIAKICTHQLQDPQHDPIWNTCNHLSLLNGADDRVKVIFMPVYLDGYDGLLNIPYYDVLSGCDLGVFPSYYEPWGYTPLECAAHSVPTVTTDLAGFGLWVKKHFKNGNRGVIVLDYGNHSHDTIVENLAGHMQGLIGWSAAECLEHRKAARMIAERTDWEAFYPAYLTAYGKALESARKRELTLETGAGAREFYYTGTDSVQPRFKRFSVITALPDNIRNLRDIGYNLWWTWDPEIRELFSRVDPQLWTKVSHNPVELLEQVSVKRLDELAENESFLRLYNWALTLMEDQKSDNECTLSPCPAISEARPIAYFSTEYGLHESLPVYSGGLGVLSGDHLKTASNMCIPMVGVGLLYKSGYFDQRVDREGNQIALYTENDFSRMPMRICENKRREPIKIHVNLPGRKLTAQVWRIDIGRVPLFLLDTYVPENSSQDMQITSRLYGGDQRLRIEQEIMLGIGGVRLLQALGIQPSIYHLNEGHSAFLLLERIRLLMEDEGLSFHEAREFVRASSVFTTHSPVEAAIESFEENLMRSYFSEYVRNLGISWETFWEMGQEEPGAAKPFIMTVLGLKMSSMANAVSRLHGRVARKMWKHVWSGFEEDEVPVASITNGVHMRSWVANEMRNLLDTYVGVDWCSKDFDKTNWDKIADIPDKALWHTHIEIKGRLVDYVKKIIAAGAEREGIPPQIVNRKIAGLDANALIVGFARRFATYKRATLLGEDPERLWEMVKDPDQPVAILFAGKAHPNDEAGKALMKRIVAMSYEERFLDKIFFIENYDMNVARHLVQGVDVWLNNPLRTHEASGTSGMKVAVNGGLNLSIPDGWWDEACDGKNGWTIGQGREYANLETQNIADSRMLYDIFLQSVKSSFFKRNAEGIPEQWVQMMKHSIRTIVPRFSTHRMLRDYYETMYLPVAKRADDLRAGKYERARALSDWKLKIASRFSTDHIRWFRARGFSGERLALGDEFEVEVGLDLGKLMKDEIRVELVVAEYIGKNGIRNPEVIPLARVGENNADGTITYAGKYRAGKSGRFVYGIRVMPNHPDLLQYQEPGLVHWA